MKYNIIALLIFLYGCGIQINDGLINNLSSGEDATNPTGTSVPTVIDQIDDDNTASGFGGGTHLGTTFSDGVLKLNSSTNNSTLSESWTPKWNDLVLYWKFDNGSWSGIIDEVIDSSGNNNHGTADLGAPTSSSGKFNNSSYLSGSSDRIRTPSISGLLDPDEGTFATWYKTNNHTSGFRKLFNVPLNGSNFISIAYDGSANTFIFRRTAQGNTDSMSVGEAAIAISEWVHVAYTWSVTNDEISIYLNGRRINSRTGLLTFASAPSRIEIGGVGGESLGGHVDEYAVWDTPLSADEVKNIYDRQVAKTTGEYKSRIMDSLDSNSSWTNIDWITTLPFGKELPGNNDNESSSDYSSLVGSTQAIGDNDLLNGLTGLWRFNESSWSGTTGEVLDSSGNNNHGTTVNFPITSTYAKFNRAGYFDGSNQYVEIPNSSSLENIQENDYTMSAWVMPLAIPTGTGSNNYAAYGIMAKQGYTSGLAYYYDQTFTMRHWTGGSDRTVYSSSTYTIREFHHVVGVVDRTNGETRIYVNGKLEGTNSWPANSTTREYNTETFKIGISKTPAIDYTHPSISYIDEVGIWARALNEKEILQLYRRGANRVKFQIRSCTNNDCSDQNTLTGDGWMGPGGNNLTYFRELYNNTAISTTCTTAQACFPSEITTNGNILSNSPSNNFSDFGSDGISVSNNRYFQYRAILESDDIATACDSGTATCTPEVKSIEIGPEHTN